MKTKILVALLFAAIAVLATAVPCYAQYRVRGGYNETEFGMDSNEAFFGGFFDRGSRHMNNANTEIRKIIIPPNRQTVGGGYYNSYNAPSGGWYENRPYNTGYGEYSQNNGYNNRIYRNGNGHGDNRRGNGYYQYSSGDRRHHRSTLEQVGIPIAAAGIGFLIGRKTADGGEGYSSQDSPAENTGKETAKCVVELSKAYRKAKLPLDERAIAMKCGLAPTPEAAQTTVRARGAQQVQETCAVPNTVVKTSGELCNNTANTILVTVDGKIVGTLRSGMSVELSRLPKGNLGWRRQ